MRFLKGLFGKKQRAAPISTSPSPPLNQDSKETSAFSKEDELLKQAQNNPQKILELARSPWPGWYFGEKKVEFDVLRKLGPQATNAIVQALQEKLNRGMRSENEVANDETKAASELCRILGEFKDEAATPILIAIIRGFTTNSVSQDHYRVSMNAINALGQIGDERAITALQELMMHAAFAGEDSQQIMLKALKQLKSDTKNSNWREIDNMGTRIESFNQALGLMMSDASKPKLIFALDSMKDAQLAFLNLSFIHLTNDTNKLISSEILEYGFYQVREDLFHAVIMGSDLDEKKWEEAITSFTTQGGRIFEKVEPVKKSSDETTQSEHDDTVVFVREDEIMRTTPFQQEVLCTYRIYRANSAKVAKEYLSNVTVNKPFLFVIVETPEGSYARDNQGIYREK